MYDSFDSDIYFFSSEVTFLLEKKDLNGLIELTKKKHQEELKENIEFFYRNYDDMSYVDKEFNINISLGTNAYLAEKKLNAILKAIEKINKKYGKGDK